MTSLKKNWRTFKRGTPGKRFQSAYENARRHRKDTPLWFRILRLGLALVALALGVVFAVIPGPAFVFFAIGGVLLATESRRVSIALDWLELRLRELGRWARKRWDGLALFGRIVVVTMGVMIGAMLTTVTGWFFFMR